MNGPYFRGADGGRHYFSEVARRVHVEKPEVAGQHIFVQLEALGMRETFDRGDTPYGLPFTFSTYLEDKYAPDYDLY